MKPYIILFGAFLCYGAETDPEQPGRVSISVESTMASQYLWRGFVLNDSPSLQPGVSIAYQGLTVSSWSNLSRRAPNQRAWTETDLTVDYTRKRGKMALSASYSEYRFPDLRENNHTEEIGFGIQYDAPASPSFRYYRDINLGKGDYFFAGAQQSFRLPLAERLTANVAGGVGLNHHQYQSQTTISDVDLTISVEVPAGRVKLTPFVTGMSGHRTLFGTHAAFGVKFTMSN